jgi:hypothetical protein
MARLSCFGNCGRQGSKGQAARAASHGHGEQSSGARQQDSSPTCPTLSFGASSFGSGRPRGPSQPGVGLQGSIGRLPRRSRAVTRENFVHVHEPSGISVRKFWWRAPLGLIVVRHGRGMQSAPADDSTSQERAARANDGKALPLAWRDDTILSYLAFCYQNSTRCPYSTVPATSTISGAPHSSTCNFLARTQR